MTDSEIIEAMAQLWVSLGGDSEGFAWVWSDVQRRIKEVELNKEDGNV